MIVWKQKFLIHYAISPWDVMEKKRYKPLLT